MNKVNVCLLVLPMLAVSSQAIAEGQSLEAMKQRCQEAREQNIAPLREAAIEECLSRPRTTLTREDCERKHQDFGQGGGTVDGGFRAGLFIDLPECVEYFDALDSQQSSGSRR